MNNAKKVYIENCTIFGKVECTHCGSDTQLFYIETLTQDMKERREMILCKTCIKDIPSYHDENQDD